MPRIFAFVTPILFAFAPTAIAQPKLPDGVELIRDVEYGKGGERALKMHLLRPKNPPKDAMPVIVWIHGGAWLGGHRDSGIPRLAPFAERGYFCATIEYRFSQEAIFPAQIEDAKCAIRFLRAKAKDFHLDPERIGVWGYSAGGHLVALLGTSGHVKKLEGNGGWAEQSSRVRAVCDLAGPADFSLWGEKSHPAVIKLLGGAVKDQKERAADASSVRHITKGLPPFLIIHGETDATVPVAQAIALNAALKKAGADVTLNVLKGVGHNLTSAETDKMAAAFFDRHLKASAAPKVK